MKRSLQVDPAAAETVEDTISRGDLKRANRVVEETLARLTLDLCALSSKQLASLELDERLHDVVRDIRSIKSPPARKRQLRLIRGALRDANWAVIQERVSTLLEHGSLPSSADAGGVEAGLEATWLSRLLGEGFVGLDAFLDAFPRTDRARLKALIHNVDRDSGDRRVKAERKLGAAIRSILRSGQ